MKKTSVLVLTLLVSVSPALALFGIGAYGARDPFSVAEGIDGRGVATLHRDGFDGATGGGLFVYVDALPFIDFEANVEATGGLYEFTFGNALAEMGPVDFGWARASTYLTLRKQVFGLGLPVLGGVKLHAGGGLNWHSSSPLANLGMVEELLGDVEAGFDPADLEDKLIDYLKENNVDGNGYHLQLGAQVKVLTVNAFLNYRLTAAENVVPGQKTFSSLWLGVALGF